jgi:hypothetical protein
MATQRIVRHVTQALLGILRNDLASGTDPIIEEANIKASPPEEIEVLEASTLILFLYQVVENPFLKNTGPRITTAPPPPLVQSDALALDLYYLLIPGAPLETYIDTYEVLGAAMRSFHDHGIFTLGDWVPADDIEDSEAGLQFRVDFNRLETADLIRIWEAVQKSYRLSVSYVIRTVQIDSQLVEGRELVVERQFRMEQS